MTSVLFVCLGNICRSPLAEGVFRHLTRERGVEDLYHVDSAGTGSWHVGEPPDRRSAEVARRKGVPLEGVARQIAGHDFERFDWILAMDRENLAALEVMRRRSGRARLHLLRDFDAERGDGDVPDPYYGGPDGFENVYALVHRAAEAFLDYLEAERLGAGRDRHDGREPPRLGEERSRTDPGVT
jgi:protein-tyrosine phosphatase